MSTVNSHNSQLPMKYVDDFRFIARVNTRVRNLSIISQAVKILGSRQIIKPLLKKTIDDWNAQDDGDIAIQHISQTNTLNHYLEFAHILGLLTRYNEVVTCSRLGILLYHLTKGYHQRNNQLYHTEKLLYLILLFTHDADTLLLLLDLFQDNNISMSQEEIFSLFPERLKQRLLFKRKYANEYVQSVIYDKYNKVTYTRKDGKRYSKHIIPPRLEWMRDLGLLEQTEKKSCYQLTERGQNFYYTLYQLPDSTIRDVNESWLHTHAMRALVPVVLPEVSMRSWGDLAAEQQVESFAPVLQHAFRLFDTEGIRRVSLYPSVIFMMLQLVEQEHVIVEFRELEDTLKAGIVVDKKCFAARIAARPNEGYITMNLG